MKESDIINYEDIHIEDCKDYIEIYNFEEKFY